MSNVRAWDDRPVNDTKGQSTMTTDYRLDGSTYTAARSTEDRDIDATLNRPATTTPSFQDTRPTGNVPGLRPNPGMLRALLQPVLFLTLLEPVGAFEVGDVLAAQFWGEGRVMLTPLPAAAARGRIPTTFPANQIHAEITGPRGH